MSGTSLDGLDVALCHFNYEEGKWRFKITDARTFPYQSELKEKLGSAHKLSAFELSALDVEFGHFSAVMVRKFLEGREITIDFLASHGHTVFHQPQRGITWQIGSGAVISADCDISCISDFRSKDVALGGQGAPLVPVGDELLFGEYDFCLNLGGFSNISFRKNKQRMAFDICPVNLLINHYCRLESIDFDEDGKIAAGGVINESLLGKMNELDFYHKNGPKSLGREWVENEMQVLIDEYQLSLPDKLRTIDEHIALQISSVIHENSALNLPVKSLLLTGGGAYNKFLIDLLKSKNTCRFVLPDPLIIEFKEALIFAFLGVLRMRNEVNCLSSVTGAKKDNCGGSVFV